MLNKQAMLTQVLQVAAAADYEERDLHQIWQIFRQQEC